MYEGEFEKAIVNLYILLYLYILEEQVIVVIVNNTMVSTHIDQ